MAILTPLETLRTTMNGVKRFQSLNPSRILRKEANGPPVTALIHPYVIKTLLNSLTSSRALVAMPSPCEARRGLKRSLANPTNRLRGYTLDVIEGGLAKRGSMNSSAVGRRPRAMWIAHGQEFYTVQGSIRGSSTFTNLGITRWIHTIMTLPLRKPRTQGCGALH